MMGDVKGLCHICGKAAEKVCKLCGRPTCKEDLKDGICTSHVKR